MAAAVAAVESERRYWQATVARVNNGKGKRLQERAMGKGEHGAAGPAALGVVQINTMLLTCSAPSN